MSEEHDKWLAMREEFMGAKLNGETAIQQLRDTISLLETNEAFDRETAVGLLRRSFAVCEQLFPKFLSLNAAIIELGENFERVNEKLDELMRKIGDGDSQ